MGGAPAAVVSATTGMTAHRPTGGPAGGASAGAAAAVAMVPAGVRFGGRRSSNSQAGDNEQEFQWRAEWCGHDSFLFSGMRQGMKALVAVACQSPATLNRVLCGVEEKGKLGRL